MQPAEHEALVLHHLLTRHECIGDALAQLRIEMFQDKTNRGFFSIIIRGAYERSFPFTTDTLIDTISSRPGNLVKRTELIDRVISFGVHEGSTNEDLQHSITQLARNYKQVRMCEAMGSALKELQRGNVENGEQAIFSLLDDIQDVGRERVCWALAETRTDALKRYKELEKSDVPPGITCGFPRIDKITGGLRPGRLWIWAAYVGHCKTHCAKEVAYHVAAKGGRVLFISLEMEYDEVERLFHVRHANSIAGARIKTNDVENGDIPSADYPFYEQAVRSFDKLDITIWVPGRVTMAQIGRRISAMQMSKPLDLVVIDYLQLVSTDDKRRDQREELVQMMRDAKQLTRREHVPIIALHQMSRDGWKEAEKRGYYIPSDASGSAETERSADVMVWNLYTSDMEQNHEIKVGVCKNRHGKKIKEGYYLYAGLEHAIIAEKADETGTNYFDAMLT